MKATVTYDVDGTETEVINAPKISVQLFGHSTCALVKTYDEDGSKLGSYHYTKVYRIHRDRMND